MGYRHNFISSDIYTPTPSQIPKWFKDKYERTIHFESWHWHSYSEQKRYGVWENLEKDIQKMLIELNPEDDGVHMRLVFFADESDLATPDISHVVITKNAIVEMFPTGWRAEGEAKLVPEYRDPSLQDEFDNIEMPEGEW